MSKIYHQSITDGRKPNVLAQDYIFSSISEIKRFPMIIKNVSIFEMLKNHRKCTGWLTGLSAHHATRLMKIGDFQDTKNLRFLRV